MPGYLAISVGDGCHRGRVGGLKDLYAIGFIDKLPRRDLRAGGGRHPSTAIAENKPGADGENTLADSIAVGVPRNADKALVSDP